MNQDQIITLVISELSKDSRLRQLVQQIAIKASGGVVKSEPPWPGNMAEVPPAHVSFQNLGMVFNYETNEWIKNPYEVDTLLPSALTVRDFQGNIVATSGTLDEPPSGIKVHPNGFTEYRDSNGNVVMEAGTPQQREEVYAIRNPQGLTTFKGNIADSFGNSINTDNSTMNTQTNWPTYSEMVRNLFKSDPVKTNMVMHAAIGLAGESGEMRAAKDYKEACEEAGDMIFYLEALRQQLPPNHGNVELLTEVTSSPYYRPSHATVVDNIHIITCEILDVAKKSWVYGREIDSFKLGWMIELLQIQLDYYCTEYLGLTVEQIQYQNQAKLMVRYEGGKYSNEAAIARKDKQ